MFETLSAVTLIPTDTKLLERFRDSFGVGRINLMNDFLYARAQTAQLTWQRREYFAGDLDLAWCADNFRSIVSRSS